MKHDEHLHSKSWNQQNRSNKFSLLSYAPLLMALIVLPVLMIGLALSSFNPPDTSELLRITIHARGDTGEEVIALILDNEVLETYSLTDRFAKYNYSHPYAINEDDIQVTFLNDGLTDSGETKGIKLDYVEVEGRRFTTKQSAEYVVSDTTTDAFCQNVSKDPTEVSCAGTFEFTVANNIEEVQPALIEKHRILISAAGTTGREEMLLRIKGQEVQQWRVETTFRGYAYGYEGTIAPEDIQIEFLNDGVTNGVNRNIDVDYMKINDKKFEAEAPSVYSTGTWTPDTGCAPGFKQKARISCNGYLQFNIGMIASTATPPPPITQVEVDIQEEEQLQQEIAVNTSSDGHDHDHSTVQEDSSTFGGSTPSPITVGSVNLADLKNPLVQSSFVNVPSSQLNVSALTDLYSKTISTHRSQGQFRTRCQYSHFGYDDPIVYPGKEGVAHLHTFFGNTKTNYATNDVSLLDTGGGSCQGGELNRTAYWIPTAFDAQGKARVPYDFVVYYKTDKPDKVEELPVGIKMLTNTASNTTKITWTCSEDRNVLNNYNTGNTIPDCRTGDLVQASIGFPSCWDGRLDSSDHKSHLAYSSGKTGCPSSHPRVLPTITYHAYYKHEGNTSQWYLSSDRFNGGTAANGSTLHGDWYGGWNKETMTQWTNFCTQGQRNCGVGPIGDNKKLKSFSKDDRYSGPSFIADPRLKPQK